MSLLKASSFLLFHFCLILDKNIFTIACLILKCKLSSYALFVKINLKQFCLNIQLIDLFAGNYFWSFDLTRILLKTGTNRIFGLSFPLSRISDRLWRVKKNHFWLDRFSREITIEFFLRSSRPFLRSVTKRSNEKMS